MTCSNPEVNVFITESLGIWRTGWSCTSDWPSFQDAGESFMRGVNMTDVYSFGPYEYVANHSYHLRSLMQSAVCACAMLLSESEGSKVSLAPENPAIHRCLF